jgi:ATP-dependent DNA helicase RecG
LLYRFAEQVTESLPQEIVKKHKFLPINEALWQLHFPESFEAADAAKARFSFEELFLIQLNVLKQKIKLQQKMARACPMNAYLMKEFTDNLPFQLTDSQKKCAFAILKDLEKPVPMSRLLEAMLGREKGCCGNGFAEYAKHGYQIAFLAPTEILAKQHFKFLCDCLENSTCAVGFNRQGRKNF